MARAIRNWLLRQLNSKDVLDGVTVTVKVAVEELGSKTVAAELRRIAKQLESTGNVKGWRFPQPLREIAPREQDSHSPHPRNEAQQSAGTARLGKRVV